MKLRLVLVVVCLLGTSCGLNRAPQSAGGAASAITERSIRSHMEFLAGDALNGRGSGTRDEWLAAAYVGARLRDLGLEPLGDDGGFVQRIEIERPETSAPPVLTFDSGRFTHGAEIRVQSLGGPRTSGALQKFAPGVTVKPGAVLLMPADGEGRPQSLGAAMQAAGAASMVLVAETATAPASARLPAPPARLVGVQAATAPRPSLVALGKEAYAAVAQLAEGATLTLEAEVKAGTPSATWNAVGRLTGSEPTSARDVILLSAHIDHLGVRPAKQGAPADTIFNGADDDASGTVAVLSLAEAFARGPRPKRTLVFAFFGSEEAGGFGSRYFADRPVVPLAEIVANLQFEMIGRPDAKVPPHTLWLTGYERSTLGPALAKQGARLVQDPHPEQSFFTRSDNIQFARRGVIAHTVSSYGLHKEYHQPSDELGAIDFAHMTDAIRSMVEPIRWLANAPFKPDWLPGMKP